MRRFSNSIYFSHTQMKICLFDTHTHTETHTETRLLLFQHSPSSSAGWIALSKQALWHTHSHTHTHTYSHTHKHPDGVTGSCLLTTNAAVCIDQHSSTVSLNAKIHGRTQAEVAPLQERSPMQTQPHVICQWQWMFGDISLLWSVTYGLL